MAARMTRHSKLDELYPEARVEINPADAAMIGMSTTGSRCAWHPGAGPSCCGPA